MSELTPCGPECDQQHLINEPHNTNAASPTVEDYARATAVAVGLDPDEAVKHLPSGPAIPEGVKMPSDRQPSQSARQRAEAGELSVVFDWDGDTWTIDGSNATSMEFYAALADAEDDEDPSSLVRALRMMLGREQAARLFKGRDVPAIYDFFQAAGEAVGSGNR